MLVAIVSFIMLYTSRETVESAHYSQMLTIAERVERAYKAIQLEKAAIALPDNHYSGMIGAEFTGITTTLGAYEAKTTATNPNFSSIIYRYVEDMQLKRGDTVALNFSGSFPALNLQAVITLEAMGLKPVIITSFGASTFGATDPEMTYVDMEYLLYQKRLIGSRSSLVSPGGDCDLGINMESEALATICERLEGYGYTVYTAPSAEENLKKRLGVYGDAVALINIGGNAVSGIETYPGVYGLLENDTPGDYSGVIGAFLSQGKPVLHLLNIKEIALKNNLPIDPETIVLGKGGAFTEVVYSLFWLIALLASLVLLIVRMGYDRRRETRRQIWARVHRVLVD